MHQVIHIHPEAPAKPAVGEPCNGCGVCCLAEPCPVGVIVSRKRHGACKALVWSQSDGRYFCGLLVGAASGSGNAGAWWRRWARAAWLRWARRMISAGSGCDASLEVEAVRDQNGK
ncbi:MAG: hypothetical protein HYX44_05175 [Aquabacterium sp.]|nr:hypothetical protein [Aquabacterium sp.]